MAGLQNQELTDLAKNAYKEEKIREVNEDKQVENKGNTEKGEKIKVLNKKTCKLTNA